MQHLELQYGGIVREVFRPVLGQKIGWGAELKCLGLILGYPFLQKFGYKSGRQMCGP